MLVSVLLNILVYTFGDFLRSIERRERGRKDVVEIQGSKDSSESAASFHSLKIIAQLSGILVVVIAAIALVGWLTGLRQLTDIRSGYIPMAPNTALSFISLGLSLYILLFKKPWSCWFVRLCTIPVIIIAAFRLIEFSSDIDLKVDSWFFYFPGESLGLAPVGKMALPTSINFLLAGLTLFLLSFPQSKQPIYILARIPAVAETLIGLTFILGYVYGAPLLYGGTAIPMAINTAVNFVCLGMGFIIVIVSHDLKERKEKEDALKNLNKGLENYTKQLQYVNKELEAFSYSVSHDLRAPLRAIDGFSRIMIEDYHDRLDDEGKRLLNIIRGNTLQMGKLIDDLLSFSRGGRKELKISEVNMEELARSVFDELKSTTAGRDVHFEAKALPHVYGDRSLIRQVWVNLFSNALKFTRSRQQPSIEIGSFSGENESIYYVKDNGVGFDMQYADKLFGVFQRLHSSEEFEGTGVGLAIVQRIIHRHSGRVWAEGKVGEGAIFYFTLPVIRESGIVN